MATTGVVGVEIPRIDVRTMQITLIGDSSLISHRWADKAKKQMLDKQTKQAKAAKEAKDPEQDWFKAAPQDLKDQFNKAVQELTDARTKKVTEVLVEKTNALKNVRTAIGEAFTKASGGTPESTGETAQPEAASKEGAVTPPKKDEGPKPPAL